MPERLVRIAGPHFCAGLVVVGGVVCLAAPILGWAVGRRMAGLAAYFSRKGWVVEEVGDG